MRSFLLWLAVFLSASAVCWLAWSGAEPAVVRLTGQRRDLMLMMPVLAGGLIAGGLLGLWRRERVRSGDGYSSPMIAWIGKRSLFACACAAGVFATAPVEVSSIWLYGVSLATGVGAFTYAGNLPTRL